MTATKISKKSLGEAWVAYLGAIAEHGIAVPDDRETIREIGPTLIEVTEIDREDPVVLRFGDQRVVDLYVSKMYSQDIIPELNSTYGDRLFNNSGVDQIEWMIDRLQGKWWTKAAAVGLLKPNDPGPRIPCMTSVQAVIRDKTVLMIATFRSQNAFRAYGNWLGIRDLQQKISQSLSLPMGGVTTFIACPHIYESDMDATRNILRLTRS